MLKSSMSLCFAIISGDMLSGSSTNATGRSELAKNSWRKHIYSLNDIQRLEIMVHSLLTTN